MTLPADRFEADYLLETTADPAKVAETMAGEQSSGTFVSVPGESAELKARSAARVIRCEVVATDLPQAVPSAGVDPARRASRARVTLSWPLGNIGPSLTNLLATVAGNHFELRQVSGLRIERLRLPPAFAGRYAGPAFGVEGTRRLAGVAEGPLIGTIIKPSIGFSAQETADLVATLCAAGIDFIKDDELQSDGPTCPFEERVNKVMAVVNDHAERTGKKVMFAFNLTGDLDEMRRRHDHVLAAGGTCVMASLNSVGIVGMTELRRHAALPIHAHRNGWGYLSRHPSLGWSFPAWAALWRLAGADHMHVNGLANKFAEEDASVIEAARSCAEPLIDGAPMTVMPVFSSGQTVWQAAGTYAALGSADLIHTAGGGILAHPGGPAEGVRALRRAWEAAVAGVALAEAAKGEPALAGAMSLKA
ncbi:ribulose-bisphosphate carboxylase large subunit family protein [Acuticoccus yangtzensis]|uniref:ribulose-bisphosphate carboxylase large subunit family protein n=1 Tax=Acuticoccus yangtzensis TaxID=1443441 RepID=UPI000949A233|nr:ribulose-bisphosphate carboxylase large subunit family protein [Acuticoccus yangtzensis]